MLSIAMITYVYSSTHSAIYTSLVTALFYLPVLFFSPLFGKVVDTRNRKDLLLGSLVAEAVLCTMLFLSIYSDLYTIPVSFISVFAISSFGTLVSISRGSIIPLTVSREQLTVANSLQQMTTQLTSIVGYLFGGALLLLLHTAGILLLILILFLLSSVMISLIRISSPVAEGGRGIIEGLKYVFRNKLFSELTIVLAVLNFTASAMLLLPVIMSYDIYHSGSTGYAAILVSVSAGNIAGSYLSTRFNLRRRTGLAILGANLLDALLLFLFSGTSMLAAGVPIAAVIGIGEGAGAVSFISLIQTRTPAERLGSVLGSMSTVLMAGVSLSMISSGFLVSQFGVRNVYIIFSILLLIVSLAGMGMKELRRASY